MTQALALPPGSLAALSTDESLYEISAGQRVELPPMSAYEVFLASRLLVLLEPFTRTLGRVVTEMLFRLDPSGNLQRRPDVAFVSYQRWPANRRIPRTNAWDVVPELVIEVISPTNLAIEIVARVREYFQAGAQMIWVVYPTEAMIYVYESPTRIRVFQRGDEADAGSLLPGLRLPLADLFEAEGTVD